MPELNPYAPPVFELRFQPAPVQAHLDGPADPESVRRANLWAEHALLTIAGVGLAFGIAIVLWAVAVVIDDELRGVIPGLILLALGSTTIIGAHWLRCRLPRGRWCATGLASLCAMCIAPAAWVAIAFERNYWPLGSLLLVPLALLVALWWPGVGAVLDETYRRTVIARTPHLEPRAALPVGVAIGVSVVAFVVLCGLRL